MNKISTKSNRTYYFFYPGDINTKTGGYIYEKNILQRAKALNFNLNAIQLCKNYPCLLYTSDAADEPLSVDLGGRRII